MTSVGLIGWWSLEWSDKGFGLVSGYFELLTGLFSSYSCRWKSTNCCSRRRRRRSRWVINFSAVCATIQNKRPAQLAFHWTAFAVLFGNPLHLSFIATGFLLAERRKEKKRFAFLLAHKKGSYEGDSSVIFDGGAVLGFVWISCSLFIRL